MVTIIDHHNDEGLYTHIINDDNDDDDDDGGGNDGGSGGGGGPLRVIEPAVGSTCSLLANMIEHSGGGGGEGGLSALSVEARVLMLGAISVDCRGFDPSLLKSKYIHADGE